MPNKAIPFFTPWITEEDIKSVHEVLSSPWLTGGPKAIEFENLFSELIGVKHSISVNSCTAALHLSMRALDIGPGDEVIVPVFTFAATANAPLFCGGRPIFADIDEKTFNISPDDLQNKITSKTKAVIVVHYGGQPCDMKPIMDIAQDHNILVVEDCAHSLGAKYMGRQTGSFGIAGCFSFYPTKIITTLEGGMVTTNDKKIAERVRHLKEHSMTKSALERERVLTWYYDVIDLGYNYRLNEVQAALGISQLKRIKKIISRHVRAADYYTRGLSKINGIITPYRAENRSHVYHLYVIKIVKKKFCISRDELFDKLSKQIGLSVHYTPLHFLTFYKKILGCKRGEFPIAERVYEECLSLPMFPTITKNQIDYVTTKIGSICY